MLERPVTRLTWVPRKKSGKKRIGRSAGIEFTTSTALPDVQQKSLSALTSAVVFTNDTTTAPGNSAFHALSCSASMVAASEQPAAMSGKRTVFFGDKTAAVSAI